jgi:hypothetical protein
MIISLNGLTHAIKYLANLTVNNGGGDTFSF